MNFYQPNNGNQNFDRFLNLRSDKRILSLKNDFLNSQYPNVNTLNEKLFLQQKDQLFQKKLLNFFYKNNSQKQFSRLRSQYELFQQEDFGFRRISEKSFKILDAPNYQNDFYTHLLDWNKFNNIIIGINDKIYFHQFSNGKTQKLITNLENITLLKNSPFDQKLCIGQNNGDLIIYDQDQQSHFKFTELHDNRITCLDFIDDHTLITGGKDSCVKLLDLRAKNEVKKLQIHNQGICGLKKSPHNQYQFATGGNDNCISIVDLRNEVVRIKDQAHKAAVRALCWDYENRNLLYSGGGSDDKKMKLWSLNNFQLENKIKMNSQICEILQHKHTKELCIALGYQKNCISVLDKYNFQNKAILSGHTEREVLIIQQDFGNFQKNKKKKEKKKQQKI